MARLNLKRGNNTAVTSLPLSDGQLSIGYLPNGKAMVYLDAVVNNQIVRFTLDNGLLQRVGDLEQIVSDLDIEVLIDGESILSDEDGILSVNQYDFDTMEELEQAIEDDKIPDGATIYIPGSGGGGGGSIGSYTYDAAERKLVVTGGSTEYEYDQTTRGIIIAT